MIKRKKVIFQNDWLNFQPGEKKSKTNIYYQDLCNKVYWTIEDLQKKGDLEYQWDVNELKWISIFLTCYFEDIISQAGIFQAFTSKHYELYNKHLPFYEIKEYYSDEINQEDIKFLLWYFFSVNQSEEFFSPIEPDFEIIAKAVFSIFDNEYETAPENEYLKEFLTISEDETDFYKVREKIDWLFMRSYLFSFNELELIEQMEEMLETQEKIEPDQIEPVMRDFRDSIVLNNISNLLALRGNEWLAQLLGEKHKLFRHIANISDKKTSHFLYKGETDSSYLFEHLATDEIFHVSKKSLELTSDFEQGKTMVVMSLVRWMDEWWFTGVFSQFNYNADLILDEKNSIKSRSVFQDNTKEQIEATDKQYQQFLEFNNGNPIAFIDKGKDLGGFINGFIEYTNEKLELTEKEKKASIERAKKKGYLNAGKGDTSIPDELKEKPCIVFFNKNSGTEILFGYNEFIPDKNNPKFDPKAEDASLDLFLSQQCSADLVKYLMQTYPAMKSNEEDDDEKWFQCLISDSDFLLRFWKRENYYSKPQISMI